MALHFIRLIHDIVLSHANLSLSLCWQISDIEDVGTFKSQIINVLQDIMEIITQDVMVYGNV